MSARMEAGRELEGGTIQRIPDGWERAVTAIYVADREYVAFSDGLETGFMDDHDYLPSFVSARAPGLAITPAIGSTRERGVWRITHVASGHAVHRQCVPETLEEAAVIAERLAAVCDWSSDAQLLLDRARSDPTFQTAITRAMNSGMFALAARARPEGDPR